MFPTDAITKTYTYTTAGTFTLIPSGSNNTYMQISLIDSSASAQKVSVGGYIVINKLVAGQGYISQDMNIATTSAVSFVKLGTTVSTVNVTYVPYDRTTISTTTSTTTTVSTVNGFSYGDVLIVLFLIMIFTLLFFSELKKWIFGVRTENPMKNKYNKDF